MLGPAQPPTGCDRFDHLHEPLVPSPRTGWSEDSLKRIFLVANSARVKKSSLSREGPIKEAFFHFHLERGFPLFSWRWEGRHLGQRKQPDQRGGGGGGRLEHTCQQGQELGRRAMNGDGGSCLPPAFTQAQLWAQPSAQAVMLLPPKDPGPWAGHCSVLQMRRTQVQRGGFTCLRPHSSKAREVGFSPVSAWPGRSPFHLHGPCGHREVSTPDTLCGGSCWGWESQGG